MRQSSSTLGSGSQASRAYASASHPSYAQGVSHSSREGDPDDPTSRAFTGAVLERRDHPDCSRRRSRHLINALSPLPVFLCRNGKWVEICLGASCRGLKCPDPKNCQRIHLNARGDLRFAPRDAVSDIVAWLADDRIKARIGLSAAGKSLRCFQR